MTFLNAPIPQPRPLEEPILVIDRLCVDFDARAGRSLRVLHDVSLSVKAGETVGIVGESGCGKSMTALSIMRLIPSPPGRISAGRILFEGDDLVRLSDKQMRQRRGRDIGMIFQEPMTSLNPVYPIGDQIAEVIRRHQGPTRADALEKAEALLKLVHIPEAGRRLREFPHQLSGGMRQRVMIAIAVACEPKLLIADEPTTALDVTVQAEIFEILRELQGRRNMAMVMITHDFGAIAEMADRVVVMYAGHKIEEGDVRDVISRPKHPYTAGLLSCLPQHHRLSRGELPEIPGVVPSLAEPPLGCPFRPRCGHEMEKCTTMPPDFRIAEGRSAACWLVDQKELA